MLSPYRSVLSAPGAKLFSVAGFLARLPISTMTLGIVLLVAGRTGSYALAGAVSATYMLTSGASSLGLARLIDHWGQARLLLPCAVGFAAGLLLLVLSVELGWPTPIPHLMAALGGLCFPPVGACVRARWRQVLSAGPRLQTAFALEAMVDESVFILGPVLVTFLATGVHEAAGLLSVLGVATVGLLWLASLRGSEPATLRGGPGATVQPALGARWLLPMVAAAVCLGVLFGATEVVTVAFADEHDRPGSAGVLLAVWAAGSLIAGFLTGALHWTAPALVRFRAGAAVLAASMLPLPFVDPLPLLAVVLFLGGFAISPTLVAIISLVEANVPASRLTEGITWLTTGIGLGVAPGAALSGLLIDHFGASTAYWVPAAGGVLAACLAASAGGRRDECLNRGMDAARSLG